MAGDGVATDPPAVCYLCQIKSGGIAQLRQRVLLAAVALGSESVTRRALPVVPVLLAMAQH